MATGNSTDEHDCLTDSTGIFQLILLLPLLPIHGLIIKILAMDFQFHLPRHSILFSISLSDAIQSVGLFSMKLVKESVTIATRSTGCLAFRACVLFLACSTSVISSMSITAITVERYIACIHSFRLHEIFTDSKVRYGSYIVWSLGILLGIVAAVTDSNDDRMLIPNPSAVHYISIVCVIPSSIAIFVMQVRLFLFSRKKMRQVIPVGAFGAELELANHRMKQFKVAFMAGIVAFAFLMCMTPLSVVLQYELLTGVSVSPSIKNTCILLTLYNSLADPFIYGFGMADIRRMILRDLKKLRQFSSDKFQQLYNSLRSSS